MWHLSVVFMHAVPQRDQVSDRRDFKRSDIWTRVLCLSPLLRQNGDQGVRLQPTRLCCNPWPFSWRYGFMVYVFPTDASALVQSCWCLHCCCILAPSQRYRTKGEFKGVLTPGQSVGLQKFHAFIWFVGQSVCFAIVSKAHQGSFVSGPILPLSGGPELACLVYNRVWMSFHSIRGNKLWSV